MISNNKPPAAAASGKRDSEAPASPTNRKNEKYGVSVVDAFEGYAFEGGMRPADKILAVDGVDCTHMDVDAVRDLLRGEPDTEVRVKYERSEFNPVRGAAASTTTSEAVLRRQLVRMSDVKLATLLGNSGTLLDIK